MITDPLARAARRIRAALPQGRLLPDDVWHRRHLLVVRLALLQAVALGVFALARGNGAFLAALTVLMVAAPVVPAIVPRLGREWRGGLATVSLVTASIMLVHLTNGLTEAHFHFFVMMAVVALYQDWGPFGVGVVMTVLHHGLMGALQPHHVFGNDAAMRDPWLWAGIHGAFMLAQACASLAAWRMSEQQGLHDPLTRLANRTLMNERLERALGDGRPVSVLFIDLDDFKGVNDSRGHWAGDRVLVAVAERLRGAVRAGDTVARLGGDEFALIVEGPEGHGRAVAERVVASLDHPIQLGDAHAVVRGSVGVASTAGGAVDADAILRRADLAMYEAKSGGKNRVAGFVDGMDRAARERAQLVEDLRAAQAAGQLELHYQPVVRLRDDRPVGAEALVRWRHPERGLIAPADFLPLAEETRLIVPIGEWVLRTGLLRFAAWVREQPELPGITLSVNLSAVQLADDGLVAAVRGALGDAGVAARCLTLEVAERVLAADFDRVAARLRALSALGVRIAIDDFGSGYSGLASLRRLPVDVLKIDRSFVSDLDGPAPREPVALVASIIDLAGALGLEVVAEGVETPAQADALARLGCGLAQGFLYAHPAPAAEACVLLLEPGLPRHVVAQRLGALPAPEPAAA